ncbi:M15 family metallopeptidase [Microlunatus speluncae]|uniref:M15 family metallopeptidase n=1 Tax=Microlunatus speluncae TaxID=2594267 RepID=UPI001266656A|nr:M15 family metallopeptidase [Microlunatus speluncae]
MSSRECATSRVRSLLAGAVIIAVVAGAAGCQAPATGSSPEAATGPAGSRSSAAPPAPPKASSSPKASPTETPAKRRHGEAAGAVPDGVTVFDDDVPGVAKLDQDLLAALRRAATDAADDGVEIFVNSGWRSAEYQDQLLREAIKKYGSKKEALRWVASPEKSLHVSGDAIDLGPTEATKWLSQHGADYGLCQIYDNEPWHYELRPKADDQGCPDRYADPTQDPRLQ